ncbi:unnamed protein product [Cercopithifilaria johnstoni]|uniref:Uncharacterized protein n=1 Tax=Cercopithifilaria johnstoni TaxID=2874296 RepID=A0A8J2LZS2_9BILA|nr:unnamed protein product [Cercopithifilaria johnstoni]
MGSVCEGYNRDGAVNYHHLLSSLSPLPSLPIVIITVFNNHPPSYLLIHHHLLHRVSPSMVDLLPPIVLSRYSSHTFII